MVIIALAACLGITSLKAQETNSLDTNQPPQLTQEQRDKLAIEKVTRIRWQVQTNCLHLELFPPKGNAKKIILLKFKDQDYLQKLKRINVLDCPKDFRLVWIEYVQTWERKVQAGLAGKLAIASEEFAGTVSAAHGGSTKLLEQGIEKSKELDSAEAWRQIEKYAVVCGAKCASLTFKKQPLDWETFHHLAGGVYQAAVAMPDQSAPQQK